MFRMVNDFKMTPRPQMGPSTGATSFKQAMSCP